MKEGNYLYLGVFISAITLACVQGFAPGMLPIAIYSYVAFLSFELTILELIKSLCQSIRNAHLRIIRTGEDELQLIERHISVLEKYPELAEELAIHKEKRAKLEAQLGIVQKRRYITAVNKLEKGITLFQVVVCFFQFAMYLTKIVPDNLITNKQIGMMSLLALAFMFLSFYLKETTSQQPIDIDLQSYTDSISNYYINMLEKIAQAKEDQ